MFLLFPSLSVSFLLSFPVFCFWWRAGRIFMTPSCGMLPGDGESVCGCVRACMCVCCVSPPKCVQKGFIMLYKMELLSECHSEVCCYAHNALVATPKSQASMLLLSNLLPKPQMDCLVQHDQTFPIEGSCCCCFIVFYGRSGLDTMSSLCPSMWKHLKAHTYFLL